MHSRVQYSSDIRLRGRGLDMLEMLYLTVKVISVITASELCKEVLDFKPCVGMTLLVGIA